MLDALLKSLTVSELRFIAERDYCRDADVHLHELKNLIELQGGFLTEGQYWHPYEVIELCAHSLTPGHEREFIACTLLVLRAVASGFDKSTSLDWKFDERAQEYDALPAPYRDAIIEAYQQAGL